MEPGQRFKKNGVAWEAVELCSLNGIPHVRIVKVGDSTELTVTVGPSIGKVYQVSQDRHQKLGTKVASGIRRMR